jgi:hypothetical protein
MKPNPLFRVLPPKEFSMKVILLVLLVVGAAISSMAGTTGSCSWDEWRAESRYAREEARRAREEARREVRRATEDARHAIRDARRQAFQSRMEMHREKMEFLREMRQHRLEVEREVRDSFRWR